MPARAPHLSLSVVIITLNEEKRIGDCLASVRELTDDIIVVDSHSNDHTCTLASSGGARVYQRTWSGYSEQKNFGNIQARHPWILSLDADERVSAELARSLREEFARGPRCDAYSIRFENYFGDRRIRFGAWNPEWHVRLFDRRKLEWNTDDVHEGLCSEGDVRTGRLAGCIRHLTVDSAEQLAAKTERYSTLFATKARRLGRTPRWSKVWLNPGWRFVRDYIVRLGVLDGKAGAFIAWEAARYTHLKYARAVPPSRRRRPLAWLSAAGACALLALIFTRLPTPATDNRLEYRPDTAARIAGWDDDDDNDFELITLSSDDDDDVLV